MKAGAELVRSGCFRNTELTSACVQGTSLTCPQFGPDYFLQSSAVAGCSEAEELLSSLFLLRVFISIAYAIFCIWLEVSALGGEGEGS